MDYVTVREWADAEPFEPFRLVMIDGRCFDIRHPNLVWPVRNTVVLGLPDNPNKPAVTRPPGHGGDAAHRANRAAVGFGDCVRLKARPGLQILPAGLC